jgi:hypothetical protein
MAEFDIGSLRRAYDRNPAVKRIMDYVANRKNNSEQLIADRLEAIFARDDVPLARGEIVQAFKEFQNLGLGEFLVGRRGQPTRFRWRVQMIEAGRSARGEIDSVPLIDAAGEELEVVQNAPSTKSVIRHSFNLRPNFSVDVSLPPDFSEREASRLAEFIKTLPFDASE